MTKRKKETTRNRNSESSTQPAQLTFMEHVRELQSRRFVVAIAFLLIAVAAFPFFDKIVNVIVAPLGKDQELVYLTPGGAFGFMIQVCMYVGLIGALPIIIYQIYRFIMPAVQKVRMRRALGFTLASLLLAFVGIAFSYAIILPAAIYFLTSFDLYHINPMLTVDSYFSFVMTYVLAGALLFQLPLVMLVINSVRPLTPKKLMGYQGKVLLFSFIIAAIISPTPDALNQTLLACPVVVMYQFGIFLVWLTNRSKHKKSQKLAKKEQAIDLIPEKELEKQTLPAAALSVDSARTATKKFPDVMRPQIAQSKPEVSSKMSQEKALSTNLPTKKSIGLPVHTRSLDGVIPSALPASAPLRPTARLNTLVPADRQNTTAPRIARPMRSVDGFYIPARS